MSAGHSSALYVPRSSVVHHLPASCKIVAAVLFVLAVVATPTGVPLAFAGYALLLTAAVTLARLPARLVARRMLIELPFLGFVLLLPFVAGGPQIEVLGVAVSRGGLVDGLTILGKATCGIVVSVLLAATTDIRDLLGGLHRLRMPPQLLLVAAFMVRYIDVIADELRRMRIARESRGFVARGPRSWLVLARSLGALFIRAYERGERVHLAMQARGFRGRMPGMDGPRPDVRHWLSALSLPAAAGTITLVAGLG